MITTGDDAAQGMKEGCAGLAMYAGFQPLVEANERLLMALFERLNITRVPAPDSLSAQWLAPGLLVSQTCGYPLMTQLANNVRVIGRPAYLLPSIAGAAPPPGFHRSVLIVHRSNYRHEPSQFRHTCAALNSYDSNSGMNLFRHWLAPYAQGRAFFTRVLESGSHRQSMRLVSSGEATIAAIDEVTWNYCLRFEPAAMADLKIIGATALSPTLPLIGAASLSDRQATLVRETLNQVLIEQPELADVLGIQTILPATLSSYHTLLAYEREAKQQNYPVLA